MREQNSVRYVLDFINLCYAGIHSDSLQSALNVAMQLIGKLDPQSNSTLDQTIELLSNLLLHDDTFVSDNALRCFAILVDLFSWKDVNPEALMRYCLTDVLLRSLHHMFKSSPMETTTNISVVTGLLRSGLLDPLESTLCVDNERCALDTMRFVDLLIGLRLEGRPTRTRSSRPPSVTTLSSSSSVPAEQSQQQIVE